MGISLIIVKSDVKELNGKKVCPIHLKYSSNGVFKRIPTKIFIESKYWKEGEVSSRCPDYTNIQKTITSIRKRLEDVITEITEMGGIPTPHLVKLNFDKNTDIQLVKQPKSEGFWKNYEQFLKEKESYQRGYTKTLNSLKNTLEKFEIETKKKMSFDYIFFGSFEYDFKTFCLKVIIPTKSGPKVSNVGLSNNYVNKIFSNLKIFLSWCKQNRKVTDTVKFKSLKMVRSDVLVYLNTSEVKKMYDYKKYDYPNDYPNVELINWALKASKIDHRIKSNEFVDMEKLSGGERIRLLIARIIYAAKTRNYNILLFDEIDENLNDQLAQEICNNLRDIFKDKIILYITHNEKVKSLFSKKFIVKKGLIRHQ